MEKIMKKFLVFLVIIIGFVAYRYFSGNDQGIFSFLQKSNIALKYETILFERAYGDCNGSDSPCAVFELEYPEFDAIENNPMIESINVRIKGLIHGAGETDSEYSNDEVYKIFESDYKNVLTEFTDYFVRWSLERKIRVVKNDGKILSYEFNEYSFLGGAHPNYATVYYNYDFELKKELTLNDILIPGSEIEFTELAEKKFRLKRNIGAAKDLAEAGFWFDENVFTLNDNYCLTDSSLNFFYNSYEIGPYALGTTEIVLPYEEIKSYLKF